MNWIYSLFGLARAALLPAFLAFAFGAFNATAVVDANSTSNTNAPPDGAPWPNVGQIGGGASGIYIGGGWVLTASHVGVGSIALTGTTFSPDGTWLRLTNSDGSVTDLILFHLASLPPLPSIPLVSATPNAFSQVDLVGYGLIAGSGQTSLGIYTGFYWSAAQFKSWGNNKVDLGGVSTINIGYGNLSVFSMDFTSPSTLGPTGQTSDESEVAPGDSGGGVFQKSGSVWQLAGVLDALGSQVNQPGGTAAYGDKSYAADIATYRSEITAVLNATPVPQLLAGRSGTNVLVCWPDMGVSYSLQASGSLPPNWATVSQAQYTSNGLVCTFIPGTNSFRLFRLQKP